MPKPQITDHCLIRFLERAGGMQIEQVREQLAASLERSFTAAKTLESSRFLIRADGMLFIVEGDAVVTTVHDDGRTADRLRRPGGKRS